LTREIIGVIGGTGLGEAFAKGRTTRTIEIDTPFGPPSAPLLELEIDGTPVYFLSRHGAGHRFSPSAVPYRANVFALKRVGVTTILASGAVGSLREQIEPGHLVLCDQLIDKTFRRAGTFFDGGTAGERPAWAVHVEFADPFCRRARRVLEAEAGGIGTQVHAAGTYVCMEGPQFSTRAESHMHRAWGGDVIGMTCSPEVRLAREAEMCYALIALPTDYDCWRTTGQEAEKHDLLGEIIGNLNRATDHAIRLIGTAIGRLAADKTAEGCQCRHALELAIWSNRRAALGELGPRLGPLLDRFMDEKT